MSVLAGLLQGIVEQPLEEDRYLVLADWLEENDDPRRAELLRLHRQMLATCCDPDKHSRRARWQARMVELLGQGVQPCVPQQTISLGDGVEMTFSFIPPGTFLMGSPASEKKRQPAEECQHRVTLTKGFFLGVTPVTQEQWRMMMFLPVVEDPAPSRFKGDTLSVDSVSWENCQAFCNRLSWWLDDRIVRLPTEAEWEYACRAGTTTPFFFGENLSPDQANYNPFHLHPYDPSHDVFRNKTTPVSSFPANAWGLFGMHGNIWEWCGDWYGPYEAGDLTDPQGRDLGDLRVLRGGDWNSDAICSRAASRGRFPPANLSHGCGFRVCLPLT